MRSVLSRSVSVLVATALPWGCKADGDEPAVAPQRVSVLPADRPVVEPATPLPNRTTGKKAPVGRVDWDGRDAHLSHTTVSSGPRVYATHLRTWIYERPDRKSRRLGYLRAGASTPTSDKSFPGPGCKGGWRSVEPEGYVCLGKRATLDAGHRIVRLMRESPPRFDHRLPYRYGTVRKPGVVYGRLPRASELSDLEPDFKERYPLWLSLDSEHGAGFRPEVWSWGKQDIAPADAFARQLSVAVPEALGYEPLPSALGRPRPQTVILDRMQPHVGYSFLHTFYAEGRRYGLTTHLEVVALDRLRPIVGSEFHGVEIDEEHPLPLAFVRQPGAKFSDGSDAAYRDVLALSGKRKFLAGQLHYETKDGRYISDRVASEVRLAKKMPAWAKRGEKWISVSISKQLLVAYEGETPVFATLVSSGEAGLDSPETTTATKRGWFRIHTKHVSSTMASDESGEEFELRDVPYVQYFAEGGFALHGAYWHDRFGIPKSHGCINLAPEDARRLFHWTDPPVPLGWHGALSPLRGTIVFVHP